MIEVGEYIRTRTGLIDKVVKNITDDDKFPEDAFDYMGEMVAYSDFEIVKHSKNIIDLIEEGDYVNGYRVLEKTKIKDNQMQICILKDNNSSNWRTINNETLKSVVTKEQFKSIEYIVEGE